MLLQMAEFPSFLRLKNILLDMYVHRIFFIHLSADEHFGCFHTLAIGNNAAVNRGVQICPQDSDFVSFGNILKSGIAESYGSSILNILRNLHTAFLSGCTNLHSCQRIQEFPLLHILDSICYLLSF